MRPDFGLDDEPDEASEMDLLVVLRLSNQTMGTHVERQSIATFADELEAAVSEAGVGEYDGDEFGAGECTLFFATHDMDKLLHLLRPMLKRSPLCRGGHLVRMVADADGNLAPRKQQI